MPIVSNSRARNAAVMFLGFAAVALSATQLSPVVPPYLPALHLPLWWCLVSSSGALGLLLLVRRSWPRWVVMAFGFLHVTLEDAAHQAEVLASTGGSLSQLSGAEDVVLRGFLFATLALVVATLLSMYKPGGRIRPAGRAAGRGQSVTVTR